MVMFHNVFHIRGVLSEPSNCAARGQDPADF